ncbi:hypothetical protein [Paenibacillus sp. GP183]|uniref:hypothetical protein n=1 Tax=Paenibacillus sp. GP183 TaxID=1882751 RepID=UPI000B81F842|nr:hypothetical protein [Paenibacillus sp. GP183]
MRKLQPGYPVFYYSPIPDGGTLTTARRVIPGNGQAAAAAAQQPQALFLFRSVSFMKDYL